MNAVRVGCRIKENVNGIVEYTVDLVIKIYDPAILERICTWWYGSVLSWMGDAGLWSKIWIMRYNEIKNKKKYITKRNRYKMFISI